MWRHVLDVVVVVVEVGVLVVLELDGWGLVGFLFGLDEEVLVEFGLRVDLFCICPGLVVLGLVFPWVHLALVWRDSLVLGWWCWFRCWGVCGGFDWCFEVIGSGLQ